MAHSAPEVKLVNPTALAMSTIEMINGISPVDMWSLNQLVHFPLLKASPPGNMLFSLFRSFAVVMRMWKADENGALGNQ